MKDMHLQLLKDQDANGLGFAALGVLLHIVIATEQGQDVIADEITDDPDGQDALDELFETGHVRVDEDGHLHPVPYEEDSTDEQVAA